jgi:hypothetical protein
MYSNKRCGLSVFGFASLAKNQIRLRRRLKRHACQGGKAVGGKTGCQEEGDNCLPFLRNAIRSSSSGQGAEMELVGTSSRDGAGRAEDTKEDTRCSAAQDMIIDAADIKRWHWTQRKAGNGIGRAADTGKGNGRSAAQEMTMDATDSREWHWT